MPPPAAGFTVQSAAVDAWRHLRFLVAFVQLVGVLEPRQSTRLLRGTEFLLLFNEVINRIGGFVLLWQLFMCVTMWVPLRETIAKLSVRRLAALGCLDLHRRRLVRELPNQLI